jgi:hypothetical protein
MIKSNKLWCSGNKPSGHLGHWASPSEFGVSLRDGLQPLCREGKAAADVSHHAATDPLRRAMNKACRLLGYPTPLPSMWSTKRFLVTGTQEQLKEITELARKLLSETHKGKSIGCIPDDPFVLVELFDKKTRKIVSRPPKNRRPPNPDNGRNLENAVEQDLKREYFDVKRFTTPGGDAGLTDFQAVTSDGKTVQVEVKTGNEVKLSKHQFDSLVKSAEAGVPYFVYVPGKKFLVRPEDFGHSGDMVLIKRIGRKGEVRV